MGNFTVKQHIDDFMKSSDKAGARAAIDALGSSHADDKSNPHEVTKGQVGLGNVDNTADADKPVSRAQKAAIDAISAAGSDSSADRHYTGEVSHVNQDLTNPESSINEAMLRSVTQYATSWSRLDQESVSYVSSGIGQAANKSAHLYINVGNSPANVINAVTIMTKVPSASGAGINPNWFPLVMECLVRDGTGAPWQDVSTFIVLGSHHTNPKPPSASEQGIAIKHKAGKVSIISSDGTTLATSDLVDKKQSIGTDFVSYRVEVDGQQARLFRRYNGITHWQLIATVTHPTVNQQYQLVNCGMSGIVTYNHTSGAGGANRSLQIFDAKIALVNPHFI